LDGGYPACWVAAHQVSFFQLTVVESPHLTSR
jgi:hypothetical protein